MRTSLTMILLAALLWLAAEPALADKLTPAQLQAAAKVAGSANGLCPVLNRAVTRAGGSSIYKGEKIGFCCPDCRAKFDADPVHYAALAAHAAHHHEGAAAHGDHSHHSHTHGPDR